MGDDVEDVAGDGIDDRQSVDPVLQQHRDGVVEGRLRLDVDERLAVRLQYRCGEKRQGLERGQRGVSGARGGSAKGKRWVLTRGGLIGYSRQSKAQMKVTGPRFQIGKGQFRAQ